MPITNFSTKPEDLSKDYLAAYSINKEYLSLLNNVDGFQHVLQNNMTLLQEFPFYSCSILEQMIEYSYDVQFSLLSGGNFSNYPEIDTPENTLLLGRFTLKQARAMKSRLF